MSIPQPKSFAFSNLPLRTLQLCSDCRQKCPKSIFFVCQVTRSDFVEEVSTLRSVESGPDLAFWPLTERGERKWGGRGRGDDANDGDVYLKKNHKWLRFTIWINLTLFHRHIFPPQAEHTGLWSKQNTQSAMLRTLYTSVCLLWIPWTIKATLGSLCWCPLSHRTYKMKLYGGRVRGNRVVC